MKDSSTDKIIHSSLQPLKRIGLDSDFPSYPSCAGLIIKRGSSGYHLTLHTPKLSSVVTGEYIDLSTSTVDLDTRVRADLLSLSNICKELSIELLSHSARLRALSKDKEETLIHDSIPESSIPPLGKNHAKDRESIPSLPRSLPNTDLDLFD